MSSPEKIREDLEEIKSELGGMGERLKTSANEGNWHISPSAGGGGRLYGSLTGNKQNLFNLNL